MALMTTSGSMPFSLASASIVCCNGFDISLQLSARTPLPDSPVNAQRHVMPPSIVGVDEDVSAVDAAEGSFEERLPVHRFAHHQLGAPATEAPVISGMAEWSIEPRRRDFQRVRRRHHVLDVEHRAQIAADPGAIVDADAVLAVAAGPGRSSRIRNTMPLASRRNWTSKMSRP